MRNKIIIIISIIVLIVLISFSVKVYLNTKVDHIKQHTDVEAVDIADYPIGAFNKDGTITDGYGEKITPDEIDPNVDPLEYKTGTPYRPIEDWFTECSYSPEIELSYAKALSPFIQGTVTYRLALLDGYDYSEYAELADTIDSIGTDMLMDIRTDTDHYIATNDLYKIYWTRVGSGVINEVVYN